jgi:hypothetical protein
MHCIANDRLWLAQNISISLGMSANSLFLTVKNHINISLMDDSKAAAAVIGRRKLNCTYRQTTDIEKFTLTAIQPNTVSKYWFWTRKRWPSINNSK